MRKMPLVMALSLFVFSNSVSFFSPNAQAQIRIQPPQRVLPVPTSPDPNTLAQFVIPNTIRGISVNRARVTSHVMRPTNLSGVTSDDGLDSRDIRALPRVATVVPGISISPGITRVRPGTITVQPPVITRRPGRLTITPGRATVPPVGTAPNLTAPILPSLNVNGFGDDLHAALKDVVGGYFMRMLENGQPIYTLQWNWSIAPGDGGQGWGPDRNMHIASVSKLMTAIGMTRLLEEKNISPDTPIIGFLPTYWQFGPNINQITFRDLLTHRSGFSTGGSSSDYQFMKARVASGVTGLGGYDYENMNFGLCRILMAVINGNVAKNMTLAPIFASLTDQLWDAVTIDAYDQYMQNNVFAVSGVANADLTHPGNGALAYDFPGGSGWNSGDLSTVSGGAGWHMSPNEVLSVMANFRHAGNIVSRADAQRMLDNGFGIDRTISSPAGTLYEKNGLWRDGNGRTEQNVAYFLPGGQELVVYVNSPIGQSGASLRELVKNTYLANVE